MDESSEILLETAKFRVVRKQEVLAAGGVFARDVIEHPGAVAIVAMLDRNHVCLIENVRVAVGETLVELPAGTLDVAEEPRSAAFRELAEETGYRAANIVPLCQCYMSPGILQERMHIFLATDLTLGETALESGEQITTKIVAWHEAMRMIDDGRIDDAKSIVGLLYYDRLRSD